MEKIIKHIMVVNFTAYFTMGWSFFMIFIIPFASKELNITINKTSLFLSISEMLVLFILSVGVTAKRYALLWLILIILLIDTVGVSFILGISRPIAIVFRLIAIGLVINGIRSATLLKDLSNFYKAEANTPNSGNKQKAHTYEQKNTSAQKEKVRSDFDTDIEYYYYILNVNNNSSTKEIKSAYITAIKKNHPDKYEHLGKEFVQFANIRTTLVNEAMDYLRNTKKFN